MESGLFPTNRSGYKRSHSHNAKAPLERILLTFCSEAGVVVAAEARVQRSSLQPEFKNPLEKFRKI
jgi:hypothetical protein